MQEAALLLVLSAVAVIVVTGVAYAVFLNWRRRDRTLRETHLKDR